MTYFENTSVLLTGAWLYRTSSQKPLSELECHLLSPYRETKLSRFRMAVLGVYQVRTDCSREYFQGFHSSPALWTRFTSEHHSTPGPAAGPACSQRWPSPSRPMHLAGEADPLKGLRYRKETYRTCSLVGAA